MRTIKDIAVAELKRLFFSPVAFLLLIIFTFLIASMFLGQMEFILRMKAMNWPLSHLTIGIFGSTPNAGGFYQGQLKYVYLFFPLLTMNMFSRDMGSGAFKLLLSSPVRNRQIVLGKYLALVIFSTLLISLISIYTIYGIVKIENVDLPVMLSGLAGIFLLCCIYSAIGLFLSSLTTYPIVAALCTLTVLMLMSFINDIGQEYLIIRDITYWLSMDGRAKIFMVGIISSEDLIYYFTVISFFLALTIIRLRGSRMKRSRLHLAGQYAIAILCMSLIGYFTSMPKFKAYADLTREQLNTLAPESQRIVSKMDGGLTITSYVNILDDNMYAIQPRLYKKDVARFDKYTRFKPEIKMEYVYYYKLKPDGYLKKKYPNLPEEQVLDSVKKVYDINYKVIPYKDIKNNIDLSVENFRVVRVLERENGKRTFLRLYEDAKKFPDEEQISAAMKIITEPLPKVGFVGGHGERTSAAVNDRGYSLLASDKTFRYSLVNNGLDFETVSLMAPVPDHIKILIIADPRKPFSEMELKHYRDYVDRGGNLLLAADNGKQEIMNLIGEPLGVSFLPGKLAHSNPKLVQDVLSFSVVDSSKWTGIKFNDLKKSGKPLMMTGVCAMAIDSSKGFTATPLYASDSTAAWNETESIDFIEDSAVCNPAAGEIRKPYIGALALERNVNGKAQKIFVAADADWISNVEIFNARKNYTPVNFALMNEGFYWLTDLSVPINTRRKDPIDNEFKTDKDAFKLTGFLFNWGIPLSLLAIGLIIWIRRKGR